MFDVRTSSYRAQLVLVFAVGLLASLLVAPTNALARQATGSDEVAGPGGVVYGNPEVRSASAFAVSAPLRRIAVTELSRWYPPGTSKRAIYLRSRLVQAPADVNGGALDPVVQRQFGTGAVQAPFMSFDGAGNAQNPFALVPPDTVGEIGPNHYVQMVNMLYAVYDRSGRALVPPTPLSALFAPLGEVCGVAGVGDPIVVYDQLADRWVLSQFGFLFNQFTGLPKGPYYECVAVSKTPDPTGEYNLYAFKFSDTKLNDYPKIGVWPDAYYMSANQFIFNDNGRGSYASVGVAALDRAAMIAGDPDAAMVLFDMSVREPNIGSLLPSDLDGFRPPASGAPNTFIEVDFPEFGFPTDQLTLFRFHVDWSRPERSTFTGPIALPTAPFDPLLCNFAMDCIPQKGTFQRVDALADRLMYRLAYRNFGDHESLVVNHSVDVGNDHAGIRWYEIRNLRTPFIHQQGTYAPDDNHRWMGSVAMDGNGNMGLGYSVSGSNLHPSVRYTGRLADDTPGQLTLGEGSLVEGSGSQTAPVPFARWGDYSSMTVDPRDDCTFWYTQQYLAETIATGWRTRIGAFQLDPACDATAPTAKARAARGIADKNVGLRFTTADNKGETGEVITIYRPNGKRARTVTTGLGPAGVGSVTVKAPRPAGAYRWCVVAVDGKGNESAESCAKLTVR